MNEEVPIPNPPLSASETVAFARLSPKDISIIDDTVLSCVLPGWRKVAMVVIMAEEKLKAKFPEFSDVFYVERIRVLEEQGRVQSQGDLLFMRFSELRLGCDGT